MKKSKKILYIVLTVIITIGLVLSGIYIYKNKQAKNVYFKRYAECDAKAKENPIRDVGGVKNIEELKFVVNCFENKGCYVPCANSTESSNPSINFIEIFNSNSKKEDICEKRCYYSPEYFQ